MPMAPNSPANTRTKEMQQIWWKAFKEQVNTINKIRTRQMAKQEYMVKRTKAAEQKEFFYRLGT